MQVHFIDPIRPIDANGGNGAEQPHGDQEPAVFLLYRAGHYDLLYPYGSQWKSLPQQA